MKKYFLLFSIIFSFATISYAGTIDTSVLNQAKVCHDVSCTSPVPGIINFELISHPSINIDSVTGLTGKVWGNELGWITMNPTGAGVIFSNPTTGLLTGKAWSQVSGWINFGVTGQSVTINPATGEFGGYAWTGGPYGGWIKFDCSDPSTCVKSTWRPSGSGGGGHGGGGIIDVCPNINESQQVIPVGYTIDAQGNCVLVTPDACINLPGNQASVPLGYQPDGMGACIPTQIDYCSNISGNQTFVPRGYVINTEGLCVVPPKDLCPSLPGVQTSFDECKKSVEDLCLNLVGVQEFVPKGFNQTEGLCIPEVYDACPNIGGIQNNIPTGYGVLSDGSCVLIPKDVCANLAGEQAKVPRGFEIQGQNCVYVGSTQEETIRVVALSIVPKGVQLPSDSLFIKKTLEKTNQLLGMKSPVEPYKIDLVSFWIIILCLFISFILVVRGIRLLL